MIVVLIVLFCVVLRWVINLSQKIQAEKAEREKALERERIAREKAIAREQAARERIERKIRQDMARQEREQERIKREQDRQAKELARHQKQLKALRAKAVTGEMEIQYYEPLLQDLEDELESLKWEIDDNRKRGYAERADRLEKQLPKLKKQIMQANKKLYSAYSAMDEYRIANAS